MSFKRYIWNMLNNSYNELLIKLGRQGEKRKFKDPRREVIYTKIVLAKEQKEAIDNLYVTNYGKKIPYTWHRHYTAYTGNFDVNYLPELLFIPEFERFENLNKEYTKVFEDKNVLYLLSKSMGVKMPKSLFMSIAGIVRDSNNNILSRKELKEALNNIGEAFIKPTIDSCSGNGCQVIDVQNGIDLKTGKSIFEIIDSKGSDWTIQERLICHESIRNIYSQSVNTFRIITYRWKNNIFHMPVIMRIGQGGSNLDNAHAGGMFIAVDDDGTLHQKAFTEFKNEFVEHPDTKLKFEGYRIDLFEKVLSTALHCHTILSQVGCINWDFTIDESGNPILIEANMNGGSIWMFEMAHGCGPFGEKTPEILRWIRLMEKTKHSERYKYAFGCMGEDNE